MEENLEKITQLGQVFIWIYWFDLSFL